MSLTGANAKWTARTGDNHERPTGDANIVPSHPPNTWMRQVGRWSWCWALDVVAKDVRAFLIDSESAVRASGRPHGVDTPNLSQHIERDRNG